MYGDSGFEAGPLGRAQEGRGVGESPFGPLTASLQMAWPVSLALYLPWTFCGSACMRRSGRHGAR